MFSVYNSFLPSKQCTCFATNYQTTWSKILPERPTITAQLAINSLPLRHQRLITVFTKASQCNSYYEPRECNSYAPLQGPVTEEEEKKKRKDRTVICAVLTLKMLIYYLEWTSKYRGKSLWIAYFRIPCKPEVPNHPWSDEFCAVRGKRLVIIPYNAWQLLPA
jgi:hypothetical protein